MSEPFDPPHASPPPAQATALPARATPIGVPMAAGVAEWSLPPGAFSAFPPDAEARAAGCTVSASFLARAPLPSPLATAGKAAAPAARPAGAIRGTVLVAALASRVRWEMIRRVLRQGPSYAGSLGRRLERSGSAVSRHLAVLARAGVLERRRDPQGDGRQAVFAVPARWRVAGEGMVLDFGSARVDFSEGK